jgi:Zn-dependent protease
MRFSWKLCRVAGIDVYVHPTFLLVLLIPGVIAGGFLSVLGVLAVFGCVILHELGHALMARRFGIGTVDITLYPIGGVARLQRMPRAPGAELLIALAGPAVNFAIALGLAVLGVSLPGEVVPTSDLAYFLGSLLLVNLGLGLFNLVPAFPMDGGRVLRALLSGWMGRHRATSAAAKLGRILAVVFGIVAPIASHGNLLYIALAAFIYFASRAEEAQVLYDEQRRGYGFGERGIWVAPPGYRWVNRGNGTWQLAPISVTMADPESSRRPWR